jgi:glycosyltransferase involved in cell wall biosynthesis
MRLEKNKKILIVCPHPKGVAPGQRLKYEQYIDSWIQNGYDVEINSFMSMRLWDIAYKKGFLIEKIILTISGYLRRVFILPKLSNYDLVYVFLWVTPFGTNMFEKIYRLFSKRILYDIDDLVYHKDHKSEANSFMSFLKGRGKPIYLMKKSDHVITCTPHLDNFVRQFNLNTTDISSTINTDLYKPVNDYSNKKTLVIGWSGSHSTSKYIHIIKDVLIKLSKKYSLKIHVIGDTEFKLEELDNIVVIPWSEETEVSELQKFDIGIYPLPNEEWVLGKSGLKALQYMALGIPTVATAIGANFRIIEDDISGKLVNTDAEWEDALTKYIIDAELRKSHGIEARKRVEELYSVQVNKLKYLKVLKDLVG